MYETSLLPVCACRTSAASVEPLPRGSRAVAFPRWLQVLSCSTWLIVCCCINSSSRVRASLALIVNYEFYPPSCVLRSLRRCLMLMLPSQALLLLCHLDNDLVIIIYHTAGVSLLSTYDTQGAGYLHSLVTPPPTTYRICLCPLEWTWTSSKCHLYPPSVTLELVGLRPGPIRTCCTKYCLLLLVLKTTGGQDTGQWQQRGWGPAGCPAWLPEERLGP